MGMSVSVKKSTRMTNIKHNNRNLNEKEMKKNSHIDTNRSEKNVDFTQKNLKEFYKEEFGEATKNYNEKQKRNDRKIGNYYDHIKKGKKTALQQEMIIQVGDKNDFSSEEKRDEAVSILTEYYHDFQLRNPKLKVYNAVIHNDEASPHLHLNFVPVADGYKRGLEKQVSFDKAITQQDSTLDKVRPFQDWREKEASILTEKLQERGLARKFVGTNYYKDVNEFKENKKLEKEILELKTEISGLKTEKKTISKEIVDLKVEKKELSSEVNLYLEPKKYIADIEESKKIKGFGKNILLTIENYDILKKIASSAGKVQDQFDKISEKYDKLSNSVAKEYERLATKLLKVTERADSEERRANSYNNEIVEFDSENTDLKEKITNYKRNEIVYKSILKDTGRDPNITDLEKKGRLALDNLERGKPPKSVEKSRLWESAIIKNVDAGLIPKNRTQGYLKGLEKHIQDKTTEETLSAFKAFTEKKKLDERQVTRRTSSWDRGR